MKNYKDATIFYVESSSNEKESFSKVMENADTALIILGYRCLRDNINNSYITKNLFELSKYVIKSQINIRRLFIRFKNKTVFPSRKYKYKRDNSRHYYTLKNVYQNKEENPILIS